MKTIQLMNDVVKTANELVIAPHSDAEQCLISAPYFRALAAWLKTAPRGVHLPKPYPANWMLNDIVGIILDSAAKKAVRGVCYYAISRHECDMLAAYVAQGVKAYKGATVCAPAVLAALVPQAGDRAA